MENLFNQGIEAGRRIPRSAAQSPGQPFTPPPTARPAP
jgi:hypothetical protein